MMDLVRGSEILADFWRGPVRGAEFAIWTEFQISRFRLGGPRIGHLGRLGGPKFGGPKVFSARGPNLDRGPKKWQN